MTLLRIEDGAYYLVRPARGPAAPAGAAGPDRLLLDAGTLAPRRPPVDPGRLAARLRASLPGASLADAVRLDEYDAYYYGRGAGRPPLPAVRVRFADPMRTWIYVDATTARIVHTVNRYGRLERWLFNGLHSLDFAFWYDRRPLWDVG